MGEEEVDAIVREVELGRVLEACREVDPGRVRDALDKARLQQGLGIQEAAALASTRDPQAVEEILRVAREVRAEACGPRMALFAPLYVSNLCANECLYCAFRSRNRGIERRALDQQEIAREVEKLVEQGHKRVLLVSGESYPPEGFGYVLKAIEAAYSVSRGRGRVSRVDLNVAPLTAEQLRELRSMRIGTYLLFQETYHRATYADVHVGGRKRDYAWRLEVMDRAMAAGISDVGIGVLLGLYDWRFELLALIQHAEHLQKKFGVGPRSISVPRIGPAAGSELAGRPPYALSDAELCRAIAILRLAIPKAEIVLSTGESPEVRGEAFELGVSQISAGSRTNPAEGSKPIEPRAAQIQLGDPRPLDEVVRDLARLDYLPSFRAGCVARSGAKALAKAGESEQHCDPNGLAAFAEYLLDYASAATREEGERLIARRLAAMGPPARETAMRWLERVRRGEHDVNF